MEMMTRPDRVVLDLIAAVTVIRPPRRTVEALVTTPVVQPWPLVLAAACSPGGIRIAVVDRATNNSSRPPVEPVRARPGRESAQD
jgi:hypothetical protein